MCVWSQSWDIRWNVPHKIIDISDHLPIFSISSDYIRTNQRQESLFVRDKREQNILNFLDEVDCINWSNLDGYNDLKIGYNKFLERYTKSLWKPWFPIRNWNATLKWGSRGYPKAYSNLSRRKTNYTSSIFQIPLLRRKRNIKRIRIN